VLVEPFLYPSAVHQCFVYALAVNARIQSSNNLQLCNAVIQVIMMCSPVGGRWKEMTCKFLIVSIQV
jgi:hypothetical protein